MVNIPFFVLNLTEVRTQKQHLSTAKELTSFSLSPRTTPTLLYHSASPRLWFQQHFLKLTSLGTQKRRVGHMYCINEKTVIPSFSEYVLCASPGSGVNKPDQVPTLRESFYIHVGKTDEIRKNLPLLHLRGKNTGFRATQTLIHITITVMRPRTSD